MCIKNLIKEELKSASGMLWDVLLKTVPTAGATTWIVAYAAGWSFMDILGMVVQMQPFRPLLALLAG